MSANVHSLGKGGGLVLAQQEGSWNEPGQGQRESWERQQNKAWHAFKVGHGHAFNIGHDKWAGRGTFSMDHVSKAPMLPWRHVFDPPVFDHLVERVAGAELVQPGHLQSRPKR